MDLTGKTAIITGAGSGIGRAIANCFAKAGAIVGIADINQASIHLVMDELSNYHAIPLAMDVSDELSVQQAIELFYKKTGKIDILVSNAGIQHIESVVDLKFSDWKKMLSIHLDGAFLTTKACLQKMYPAKSGAIIYIGSVHSQEASKLKAPYVTAKHGLLGLCRVVAKEGAPYGVRANVVCPGFVKTPLVEQQVPLQARDLGISEEDVIKKVMLGHTVDGEFTDVTDVANACLFFASAQSNAMTGQSLIVSHGWHIQ